MAHVMTNFMRYALTVSDIDQAMVAYDERVYDLARHSGAGKSFWFGPDGGADQLRVDVDFDVDRAMLTWLPDQAYGIELEPSVPLTIEWSMDAPLATIPAELVRVSVATARQAVVEYLTTGERPTCVRWDRQRPGMSFLATSRSRQFGPF